MMRREDGLTMLELLIALTLFAILAPLISMIIVRSLDGINRQNDRQDRLAAFTDTNRMFTDYLPLAQRPLLAAQNDRLEFVTSGTEGPRYVMVWADCTRNELRYIIHRPHLNLVKNPSFEENFYYSTGSSVNSLAAVQAQQDPTYVYNEDDIHYTPVPNATTNNPRYNPQKPWGWRGDVRGKQTTASTEVNPVKSPLLRQVAKSSTNMPGTSSMMIYQPIYRNDPNTEPPVGSAPGDAGYGAYGPSNRNTYVWAQSEIYPANQGDVFIVGGYMRDNSPALGNGTSSQRPADAKLTRPRIEWQWVRTDDGIPEVIQERSGSIVATDDPTDGSRFRFKITQPAPQGADGIVLRLSPGLLTRDDSAEFDGILVERVNGRVDITDETGQTLYFDGAATTSDPSHSYYDLPRHPEISTSANTGALAQNRWLGTANRSVSFFGNLPFQSSSTPTASNPDYMRQSNVLAKPKEDLCTSGNNVFEYRDRAGTLLTGADRLTDTEQITLNLRIFSSAADKLVIDLNDLHNGQITWNETSLGAMQ